MAKLNYRSLLALSTLFLALSLNSSIAIAKQIPNFSAVFEVHALGMKLGKAKQKLTCKNGLCTLLSSAKPSGLAALMSSDSSKETIKLRQTNDSLQWLSYKKIGYTEKNGEPVEKHRSLVLDQKNQTITSYKNQRVKKSWPMQQNAYDAVSLAFGMQFAALNNQSFNDFYLQDVSFQDKLTLVEKSEKNLELDFQKQPQTALFLKLKSEHSKISLWLLPNYHYFPSKIEIINKDNKTITLNLAEPPTFYETQR